ncbi:glutamine synthetase family protein [Bittarella massiliensis (ex Durand et al. 2017)]|uniref:glutamine synthetase family protein n=1 Tax=Bittarella massiliensis (ex Durand et al. 2017) TaxID=1720313 RepID=UPI001AA1785C|nr:glutamine synthetase [Bittarella massiliensis (ex Durand et al. 2017)]
MAVDYTVGEILQFVEENDVKFIRLAFCDVYGRPKNIAIMANQLERAFSCGISFDASAVQGFLQVEESDLFLFPDPETMAVLPWRPQQGRVARFFCDIRHPDGRPFAGDGRHLLRQAEGVLAEMGYTAKVGAECEFYLFLQGEDGEPTDIPFDRAGYLDMAPLDRGEDIRREICLTLEEMGILPESSHHEQGPGQNEVDFKYDDPLRAADDLTTFRSVVQVVAAQNGLCASFDPKPLPGASGSGLHVNLSLHRDGVNLFRAQGQGHSWEAEAFLAGILERVEEITAFLNPLPQSYARLGCCEAPGYLSWSHQNRSQLIRIPAAAGPYARMELRSPDPACNPYLAFALLLRAGAEGVRERKPLCPPCDCNLYTAPAEVLQGVRPLPQDLDAAVRAARESAFVREVLPQGLIRHLLESRQPG